MSDTCQKCMHASHPPGRCGTPSMFGCRECGPDYAALDSGIQSLLRWYELDIDGLEEELLELVKDWMD